ncbi:MAG TPA: hypothetical protein VI488_09985 [Candidatus Angelobacter sp.]
MRNWLVPVTVLGLSGLGLLCASGRGRAQMQVLLNQLARHGDPLGEFLESQLAAIQRTLDDLAEALEEQSA